MKANIIFWLIGATDGHAKNVSVFLRPGGRFRLAPLYDVISAQPSVDSKQIPWKNFRLAMSFGFKAHYQMRQIAPRHFFQTAERAGIGKEIVSSIIEELISEIPRVVAAVNSELATDFPAAVANSISQGITRRMRILEDGDQRDVNYLGQRD